MIGVAVLRVELSERVDFMIALWGGGAIASDARRDNVALTIWPLSHESLRAPLEGRRILSSSDLVSYDATIGAHKAMEFPLYVVNKDNGLTSVNAVSHVQ